MFYTLVLLQSINGLAAAATVWIFKYDIHLWNDQALFWVSGVGICLSSLMGIALAFSIFSSKTLPVKTLSIHILFTLFFMGIHFLIWFWVGQQIGLMPV